MEANEDNVARTNKQGLVGGILIPKEKDASTISQLQPICVLKGNWKIFFTIVTQRLSTYLERNKYIDTVVQKPGIPGFSGYLEHTSMILQQIQAAQDKRPMWSSSTWPIDFAKFPMNSHGNL